MPLSDVAGALLIAFGLDPQMIHTYSFFGLAEGERRQVWASSMHLVVGLVEEVAPPGTRAASWDTIAQALPKPGAEVVFSADQALLLTRLEVPEPDLAPRQSPRVQVIEQVEAGEWNRLHHRRSSAAHRRRRRIDAVNGALAQVFRQVPARVEPVEIDQEHAASAVVVFRRLLELTPPQGLRENGRGDLPEGIMRELEAVLDWPEAADGTPEMTRAPGESSEPLFWIGETLRGLGLYRLAKRTWYKTNIADRLLGDSLGLLDHILRRGWKKNLRIQNVYASMLLICALGEGRAMSADQYAARAAEALTPVDGGGGFPPPMARALAMTYATPGRNLFQLLGAWSNPWETTDDWIPTAAGVAMARRFFEVRLPQTMKQTLDGRRRYIAAALAEAKADPDFDDADVAALSRMFFEAIADDLDRLPNSE
jgi:hypothetical protein